MKRQLNIGISDVSLNNIVYLLQTTETHKSVKHTPWNFFIT